MTVKPEIMINPIVRREARVALRNWRFFGAITLYISLLSAALGLMFYNMVFYSYDLSFDPMQALVIYTTLCCFQFGVILLATPALAAGSISGERERQTLDLLLTTRMSAFSIVMGKLTASVSQLILLLMASLPVFAVVFYFGGISLASFAAVMGYMLLTACMAGAVSLFLSCFFKRTVISIMLVYILFGFLCIGTLLIVFIHQVFYDQAYQMQPSPWFSIIVLAFNPAAGFASILFGQTGTNVMDIFSLGYSFNSTPTLIWALEHFYILSITIQLLMTAFFIWLSTKFIYPTRKRRSKK